VAASGLVFWYVLPFQQPRFFWGPMALALIGAAALARVHRYAPPVLLLAAGLTWGAQFAGELHQWLAPPAPALLAAVLLGAGWIALRRKPRLTRFLPLCFIAGPLVGIAVAASTGDQSRARTMAAPRWRFFGEAWTWIDQNLHGVTIAYAGNNVPYFLCGPHLENRVLYVPARKPVWGRYHDFGFLPETRALGPPHTSEPAVDRYVMDPAVWLDNIHALGVEYVLVNSMFPNLLINYHHDLEGFPVERRWLDALTEAPPDAAVRAQCRVFGGGSVRLYRLHFAKPRHYPSPSLGPLASMFSPVIRDETDALARRRQDATPPGRPIRNYPHAAAVIQRAGLRTLEP
jgi:hypothetical protein